MTAVSEQRVETSPSGAALPAQHGRGLDAGVPLVVLAAAFVAAQPLSDPDVWWHLRTGELILEEGLVSADPWSFMSAKHWQLHEWLSEVLMYAAYAAAGYAGVVGLVSVTVACFAGVLTVSCRRVSRPIIACTTALMAVAATIPGMGARPQVVSWLLLAVAAPYMRSCVRRRRLPWWLLPLVWLWANLHGLWLTALALYAALVIGLALEEGLRGWRTTAGFSGVGLLAVLAAAATPAGPALLMAPFRVREYAQFVSEWDPPSIASVPTALAVALAFFVVVGWARAASPVPASTIAFVAAAVGMGLLYGRTVPVLAIAVAPLAAQALQGLRGPRQPEFRMDVRLALASAVVAVVAVPALAPALSRASAPRPDGPLTTTAPAVLAATDAVQQLPGRARVLNQYELGGWLLWAARDTSPAIDGRAEIYEVEHVRGYVDAVGMRPGWRDFVEDLDADAAMLLRDAPLAAGLELIGWELHYEQEGLVVLVPPTTSRGA
ncbi:MAG: hypothetical protein M3P83_05905 [Actinomycetota bacterium]|nr:hypothetical protein [Actinomycetota bacterium]